MIKTNKTNKYKQITRAISVVPSLRSGNGWGTYNLIHRGFPSGIWQGNFCYVLLPWPLTVACNMITNEHNEMLRANKENARCWFSIVQRENKIDINMKRYHTKCEVPLGRIRYLTKPEAPGELGAVPSPRLPGTICCIRRAIYRTKSWLSLVLGLVPMAFGLNPSQHESKLHTQHHQFFFNVNIPHVHKNPKSGKPISKCLWAIWMICTQELMQPCIGGLCHLITKDVRCYYGNQWSVFCKIDVLKTTSEPSCSLQNSFSHLVTSTFSFHKETQQRRVQALTIYRMYI
jgi:hypothetical protein